MQNSYLRLHHEMKHPILNGLQDAPRIINGTWRLEVREKASFLEKPVTLIPSYPDLPMEKVYPRGAESDKAEVYLREVGQGRVVYIPWDIDRVFWEVLSPDHLALMRNIVTWATAEPLPATVRGSGVLDVTLWRQKNSMTLHLVNLTNPMMMKGPVRELIPLEKQEVRIELPLETKPKKVQLLAAGKSVSFKKSGTAIELAVPRIIDHEVVAVDLAQS